MARRATCRVLALAGVLVVTGPVGPPLAAATPTDQVTTTDSGRTGAVLTAAERGVANAAAHDVRQSVAVIDRTTGLVVADVDGDRIYHTESITKLFTAAYYLEQSQGAPDADLAADLRRMVAVSDNDVQYSLWRRDIVPTVVQRYGLTASRNAPGATEQNWGSDRSTASDLATFLLRASQDPWVGPSLLTWMAAAEPIGSDGFDQSFGVFDLAGDRGVKQGWSDPGWSPANLHSVGWTERFIIAILQSSDSATNRTMRATSTFTAKLIDGPGDPAVDPVALAAFGQSIRRLVQNSLLPVFAG